MFRGLYGPQKRTAQNTPGFSREERDLERDKGSPFRNGLDGLTMRVTETPAAAERTGRRLPRAWGSPHGRNPAGY